MADQVALQTKQIKELEKKLKNIEDLNGNQVFKDEIVKIQELYLQQLILIRTQTAQAIQKACEIAAAGGSGSASVVPKDDYDKLQAENKKMKYRITHLLRALDEQDGGSGAAGGSKAASGDVGGKMYVTSKGSSSYQMNMVQVLTQVLGYKFQFELVEDEQLQSKEFKAKNPTGMFPMLETSEGTICGAIPVCKFMCRQAKKLYSSSSPLDCALVDQWVNWACTNLMPNLEQILGGIYGHPENQIYDSDWKDALKNLKNDVKQVDNALIKGNGWLVAGQMTLADVVVSIALSQAFQTTLDAGYQKSLKEVPQWATKLYQMPEFSKVQGAITFCSKPLKPVTLPDPKKEAKGGKQETKKEQKPVAEAKPEKKPEKQLDNVQSLPPTSFDLFNFKTFFVNHKDKKGVAVDTFYKDLDWKGWSFWYFHYDIYEGEGDKLHVTNNLMNGFMNRAQHTSKYSFGRMAVLGEEPKLQIMGCWLLRGVELPDGLVKEHPQFEYYKTRKLDPRNNKDDDKLVREYFGGQVGDKMSGLICQTLVWQK